MEDNNGFLYCIAKNTLKRSLDKGFSYFKIVWLRVYNW